MLSAAKVTLQPIRLLVKLRDLSLALLRAMVKLTNEKILVSLSHSSQLKHTHTHTHTFYFTISLFLSAYPTTLHSKKTTWVLDANACLAAPCSVVGQTCVDLAPPAANDASGRVCACPAGTEEINNACVDSNACLVAPCSPFRWRF